MQEDEGVGVGPELENERRSYELEEKGDEREFPCYLFI